MVAHMSNPYRGTAGAEKSEVRQPWLYIKFKASLVYMRPCIQTTDAWQHQGLGGFDACLGVDSWKNSLQHLSGLSFSFPPSCQKGSVSFRRDFCGSPSVGLLWSVRWKGTWMGLYAGDIQEECLYGRKDTQKAVAHQSGRSWQLRFQIHNLTGPPKSPFSQQAEFSIVEKGRNATLIPLFHDFISALFRGCRQAAGGRKVGQSSRQGFWGSPGALGRREELRGKCILPPESTAGKTSRRPFSPCLLSGSQDTEFASWLSPVTHHR